MAHWPTPSALNHQSRNHRRTDTARQACGDRYPPDPRAVARCCAPRTVLNIVLAPSSRSESIPPPRRATSSSLYASPRTHTRATTFRHCSEAVLTPSSQLFLASLVPHVLVPVPLPPSDAQLASSVRRVA